MYLRYRYIYENFNVLFAEYADCYRFYYVYSASVSIVTVPRRLLEYCTVFTCEDLLLIYSNCGKNTIYNGW